jgi:alkaline phosphatase D
LLFHPNQRGYVRCEVTADHWRADVRAVDLVSQPGAPIATRASFVIESGQPGAVQVSGAPAGCGEV